MCVYMCVSVCLSVCLSLYLSPPLLSLCVMIMMFTSISSSAGGVQLTVAGRRGLRGPGASRAREKAAKGRGRESVTTRRPVTADGPASGPLPRTSRVRTPNAQVRRSHDVVVCPRVIRKKGTTKQT